MELILKETSGPLPTSHYELRDKSLVIGTLQLRHTPSKSPSFPKGFENHIYYEIEPTFREKGYGTRILRLGLEKARELGLSEVILTCTEENIPSRKIIETNGGELADTKLSTERETIRKYKIKL